MCGLTNIETTEFTLSQEDFMDITSDSEGEFEDEDPLHDALDDDDEPSSESSGIESQQMPPNLHIYITTDNASNISKAVAESPYHHIKCFAHTINLAVQKGLAVAAIQRQLARVRQIVKYFRKSNKGKYALQVSKMQAVMTVIDLSFGNIAWWECGKNAKFIEDTRLFCSMFTSESWLKVQSQSI